MSSSAIPHVISFLTRPLLASFPAATVTSAQIILNASLASSPNATFTLTSTSTPPPPIFAASIGAGVPWDAWIDALTGGRDILMFYGPGYLKVRVGDAQVTDVWSEETQGSIVPISHIKSVLRAPLLQASTSARLRATLLSARVRSMRRAAQEPIRIPSLFLAPTSSDSDSASDSESDSDSDFSDSASTTSSKFTAYSSLTGSPPSTPHKAACIALPSSVALPPSRLASKAKSGSPAPKSKTPPPVRSATTAYLYQGGVTRVMTGGVMLGPRRVVAFTRS